MPQPEDHARQTIDHLLAAAGWRVCDPGEANISAHRGVAIREFPLRTGHGFADYLLYVDGKAAGIIEAKKASIVKKLWNYCNVLRDDGMSYGDYVEQLTYLLFLKMADEHTRQLLLRCPTSRHPWRSQAPYNQKSPVPDKYGWPSLGNCSMRCSTSCIHAVVIRKDGDELFDHYRHTLEALGNQKGLLGLIFNRSQNMLLAGGVR